MLRESNVSLFLACILAAYAVIVLTLLSGVAGLLTAFITALQIIAIIAVLIFAAAIIIRGLVTLFGNFKG